MVNTIDRYDHRSGLKSAHSSRCSSLTLHSKTSMRLPEISFQDSLFYLAILLSGDGFGGAAGFVEGFDEGFGDHCGVAAFEVAAFEHLNELAVFDKTD